MATTPEGKIKQKLNAIIKEAGAWYFSPNAGPFGKAGIPDRIVLAKGRFIGVECKADKTKKLTALQRRCLDEIIANGGLGFVVYDTETLGKFKTELNKIMNRKIEWL